MSEVVATQQELVGKYRPYPEYKDSGVTWLGNIPAQWSLKKLKYLCSIQTGNKDTVNAEYDGEYPFFVRSQTVERISTYTADCEAVLTAGDGVGVGKVYHYYNGKFDYHQRVYMLSNFSRVTGQFVYYYLSSNFYKVALEGNAKSTVDSLRLPQFLNFEFSIPPLDVQGMIVAFLNNETARIDRLISQQQRLIELLKEKRQAVISHAVTKGLNPGAPTKDSGVEWLGQVPVHWRILRLKQALKSPMKYGANEAALDDNPENPRFIRITDMNSDGTLKNSTFKSLDYSIARPYLLNDLDLLLARSGATVGKSFLYKKEYGVACFAGYLINVRLDGKTLLPEYLYFFTQSIPYWTFITGSQIQATIQNVSAEKYGNLSIPTPSVAEQQRIVEWLAAKLDEFSNLESKAEQAISLMQERRTALISAAVTGKIDLRGWTPPVDEVAI